MTPSEERFRQRVNDPATGLIVLFSGYFAAVPAFILFGLLKTVVPLSPHPAWFLIGCPVASILAAVFLAVIQFGNLPPKRRGQR